MRVDADMFMADFLIKKKSKRLLTPIRKIQRADDSFPWGTTWLIMQRYHTVSVPGELSIQVAQVRCDCEANGADRLSPQWSCSKTSQSMNPMAPVIVALIYAAVNLQDVEDQGLLSPAQVEWWWSGGGIDTDKKNNRVSHDVTLLIVLRFLVP